MRLLPLRSAWLLPAALVGLVCPATACSRDLAKSEPTASSAVANGIRAAAPSSAAPPNSASGSVAALQPAPEPAESAAAPTPASTVTYPWLETPNAPPVDGSLLTRIPPPPGYTRLAVPPGSFAEFVRNLPLAPPGTPVTAHDGDVVRPGDDEYVEAVLALDVGSADVQQSVDVIVRLHAEWLWSRGDKSSIEYVALTKLPLPLSRWEQGQRLITDTGANVFWAIEAKPKPVDYAEFRRYLDGVFTWQNAAALAMRSRPLDDHRALLPGDFFLHARTPGHVAILLDVAEKPGGERVALLGQALNPAQSPHVLRPGRATPWFSLRPGTPLVTPYTKAFGWDELRRIEPTPTPPGP